MRKSGAVLRAVSISYVRTQLFACSELLNSQIYGLCSDLDIPLLERHSTWTDYLEEQLEPKEGEGRKKNEVCR